MLAAVLAAALAFSPADARFAHEIAGDFVSKCTPRDAGTVRGRFAADYILGCARSLGGAARLDSFKAPTPRGERVFTNVICELAADPSAPWTVVLSHFDTKPGTGCPGANDGASTTAILLALLRAVREWPTPRGNLLFVWTDGEECMEHYGEDDGFWGSKHAAAWLKADGRDVRAVICLDMLGDRDLSISLPRNTRSTLRKIALHAARRAGVADRVKEIPELVKDDHVAFQNLGFNALDIIDFDYGSAPGLNDWWHTPEDTVDKLSVESMDASGRLVAALLDILL